MSLPFDKCNLVEIPYLGKFLLQRLLVKMLKSNQFKVLFDHWYIWKEWIDLFNFFLNGAKVASKTIFFDWVFSGMPSHIQTCLEVVWVPFESLTILKIIQKEKSIMSLGKKSVFPKFKFQNFKLFTKMCSSPIRLHNSLIINLSGCKQSVFFCTEIVNKEK